MTKTRFQIGDRVTWIDPADALVPITNREPDRHGIVVWYHHSQHRPRQPRVRWQSGWGYHVKAERLRLLTPEEAATWAVPARVGVDYPFTRYANT